MQIRRIDSLKYNPYRSNRLNQSKNSVAEKPKQQYFECCNIPFTYLIKQEPVYCVNRDGTVVKFESKIAASQFLNLPYSSVASSLKGRLHETKGYCFLSAKDVEIVQEDGTTKVDEAVLKKARESFEKAKTMPVYALDYDGNLTRYDSQTAASKDLEISISSISKCVLKDSHSAGRYIFIPASELEIRNNAGILIQDKKGRPILDSEKIRQELQRFSKAYRGAICLIDYLGNIQVFETEQQAAKKGFSLAKVSRNMSGDTMLEGKYLVVKENDILQRDEMGKTIFDENGDYIYDIAKINKYLQAFETTKIKPVKAKNIATKEVITFESSAQAAEVLGVSKQAIGGCLKGKIKTVMGYTFEHFYPHYIDNYSLVKE